MCIGKHNSLGAKIEAFTDTQIAAFNNLVAGPKWGKMSPKDVRIVFPAHYAGNLEIRICLGSETGQNTFGGAGLGTDPIFDAMTKIPNANAGQVVGAGNPFSPQAYVNGLCGNVEWVEDIVCAYPARRYDSAPPHDDTNTPAFTASVVFAQPWGSSKPG